MNPTCAGSGANVLPGLSYQFKTLLPIRRTFYCERCEKHEWARLVPERGYWTYQFEFHRARGVTKAQWATPSPVGGGEREDDGMTEWLSACCRAPLRPQYRCGDAGHIERFYCTACGKECAYT